MHNLNEKREIKYSEALSEALAQAMEKDPGVFVFGVGVDDPKGIFGTTLLASKRFGQARVFDTPLSENALTGIAVGAALEGMRPVMVHARDDFFLLAMDQIINHAAKWRFMFGGQHSVPMVIRGIIGQGWGQAAQHSQSLQAFFMHAPGLKVIMPSNAYNAKGLLMAAIEDPNPVICIEHRKLFDLKSFVPSKPYSLPLGRAQCVRPGADVTIVAVSQMVEEALKAAQQLNQRNIQADVLDLQTIKPFDREAILGSLKKTGRLVIADTGWLTCGLSAEIAAFACEQAFSHLKAPVKRVALPDFPTPCAKTLETAYYPTSQSIVDAVVDLFGKVKETKPLDGSNIAVIDAEFKGPF
ncbi:MAG: alpha-ketoacid dehydrogenase subunit beta [Elusimicrobia bacterium]|nr:alpha-ketoacid dehydrogenase subunit beta [Elusimicrobiota bacterium]